MAAARTHALEEKVVARLKESLRALLLRMLMVLGILHSRILAAHRTARYSVLWTLDITSLSSVFLAMLPERSARRVSGFATHCASKRR